MGTLPNAVNDRKGNGTLMTPVVQINSGNDSFKLKTRLARPVNDGLRLSVCGNRDVIAPITTLRRRRSPLNIARLVMAVIVNSVKRELRERLAPDLVQELFKGFKAKFNAASAIISKFMVMCVSASAFRTVKSRQFRAGNSTPSFAVRLVDSGHSAIARLAFAGSQSLTIYDFVSAAFAMAKPHHTSVFIDAVGVDNCPLRKGLASEVDGTLRELNHKSILTQRRIKINLF